MAATGPRTGMALGLKLLLLTSALLVAVAVAGRPTTVLPSPISIDVPQSPPLGCSRIVDRAFPSFSIATHAFQDYAGNSTTPNIFSRHLVEVIGNKTGKAPYIRVGGTSGDHAKFVPTQIQGLVVPPHAPRVGYGKMIPLGIELGPTWFEGFWNFPGSKFIFDVHFAPRYDGALQNAVAEAQEAVKYIGSALDAIEIGNEPNFYPAKYRSWNWNPEDYVKEWRTYADAITSQALANTSYPKQIYQALVYDTTLLPWTVKRAFHDGISRDNNIKTVSLHHYGPGKPLWKAAKHNFLNHDAIARGMKYFAKDVKYLQENYPDIPLILGETNTGYQLAAINAYEGEFSDTLRIADYMLYVMSINITRMNIHQATGFSYAAWQPVEFNGSPPHVRPPFYGQAFVADFIGTEDGMQMINIDLFRSDLSAYAAYISGRLSKVAVISLETWTPTMHHPRPTQPISIPVPCDIQSVKIEYLSSPSGTFSKENITWAGQSWTYESGGLGVQVRNDTKIVDVTGGVVIVDIQASEAVLVTLVRSN